MREKKKKPGVMLTVGWQGNIVVDVAEACDDDPSSGCKSSSDMDRFICSVEPQAQSLFLSGCIWVSYAKKVLIDRVT